MYVARLHHFNSFGRRPQSGRERKSLNTSTQQLGLAALCLSIVPVTSWSCATCGCTVNSDAAMGYSSATGWRVNLEYTYIDQDQLRAGTGTTSPAAAVNNPSNPALGGGEIEKQTINHYLTLGLSYRPDSDWNFNLLVPYVVRDHTTYGTQLAPYTPSESAPEQISGAHVSNLGDVKLIPGMPVEAFVQTGDRTMLSYLIKPLSDQLMRAFREK